MKLEAIKRQGARNKITKYFPKSYTPKDMEEIINDLLGKWERDL